MKRVVSIKEKKAGDTKVRIKEILEKIESASLLCMELSEELADIIKDDLDDASIAADAMLAKKAFKDGDGWLLRVWSELSDKHGIEGMGKK